MTVLNGKNPEARIAEINSIDDGHDTFLFGTPLPLQRHLTRLIPNHSWVSVDTASKKLLQPCLVANMASRNLSAPKPVKSGV